ncbi:MAG TPA: UDP-2,3-diacylglucosamine diphosphatase [Thiomicrospira sp.]|jgi:UDP-2,3-diacylglucosamine hydrolase|nr:UDP-2,3-diacylglucosamine diphosphatase [Thiomicrospira sp.]
MQTPDSVHSSYTLVVADIHLQPGANHPINTAFMEFLQKEAANADALYILGDLFEMWVGDDIGLEDYANFIKQFKALTEAGLPIFLQYGNRDFLMKEAFFLATGITLLEDISLVKLYDEPYLFLHGDSLCTDDKGYQRMRRIFRNKVVQWIFLHLCKKRRLFVGNKMRQSSKQHSQAKTAQIMDVNQQTVIKLFQSYPSVQHMIHGHTHRPDQHLINHQGKTLHRWVLGDWRPEAQIIKIDKSGPQFLSFSSE